MSKNLKTLICCVLSLVFVCGTIIAVFADSNGAFSKAPEAVSVTEEASEEVTDVEETTTVEATTAETTTEATDVEETTTEEVSEEVTDVEETTTEEVVVLRLGDTNFDGQITAADARIALRISAQLMVGTAEQIIVADVVADGVILANDARRILRVSAQLDDESIFGTPASAELTTESATF